MGEDPYLKLFSYSFRQSDKSDVKLGRMEDKKLRESVVQNEECIYNAKKIQDEKYNSYT